MAKTAHKRQLRDIDRIPTSHSDRHFNLDISRTYRSADEVIQSLSGAYENQRAQQVGEWERVQNAVRHQAA